MDHLQKQLLYKYRQELTKELDAILQYWMQHTHDPINGGFIGRIDENNQLYPNSPRGTVLNARILWAFSAAYKTTGNSKHLYLARMAFTWFTANFFDRQYGGVFWSVDATGKPKETRKQLYAQAFALYACCAYYNITHHPTAKALAISLFQHIEQHGYHQDLTGYFEAFTQQWEPIDDLRLSEKDANEKKTMNTHLHLLEAYTALYAIWPDARLKKQLTGLINNFSHHIVDGNTGHLGLFFDEQWQPRSNTISYGHDIEAAWLLVEAATAVKEEQLLVTTKKLAAAIAKAATTGLDKDGGLMYEASTANGTLNREKHSWVQAEAMVGFMHQWKSSGKEHWLEKSLQSWQYVQQHIKDHQHGEWYWGRNGDGSVMAGQDKVGPWKCPYHNTRACIEVIHLLNHALEEENDKHLLHNRSNATI